MESSYKAREVKVYPAKLKSILLGVVTIQIFILCDCKTNAIFLTTHTSLLTVMQHE